jgi:molecular chaperone GrpE
MTDPNARPDNGAAAEPRPSEENAAAAPAAAPEDPVAALAREAADYKDRLLRALAEMENLRRRTEREVADARTYAIASFARDILTVADNMERALKALDADVRAKGDPALNSLLEGVELTERELHKVLEKHGVRKFDPTGERFDPNLHQAMYEVANAAVPAGQVMETIQIGYMIGDRILRPALVAVAKGGPKPQPASPAPAAGGETGASGAQQAG